MKLTTTRLKRIIKEELDNLLSEDKYLDMRFDSREEASKYLDYISVYEGAEGDYYVSSEPDENGKWYLVDA